MLQLTLCEFDELCHDDRIHLLNAVGILLSSVQYHHYTYMLYRVYGYYVEIAITHQGVSRVAQIAAFEDGNRLNKHLKAINLEKLLSL